MFNNFLNLLLNFLSKCNRVTSDGDPRRTACRLRPLHLPRKQPLRAADGQGTAAGARCVPLRLFVFISFM